MPASGHYRPITALTPSSGPVDGGTTVTITGTDFTHAASVLFGDRPASHFTVVLDRRIDAVSPASLPRTVMVTITYSDGGTSGSQSAAEYTYRVSKPHITAMTPNAGPAAGGTVVTITGSGFEYISAVAFGNVPAVDFTVISNTEIHATSPAQPAGQVDVTVHNAAGMNDFVPADLYTYS